MSSLIKNEIVFANSNFYPVFAQNVLMYCSSPLQLQQFLSNFDINYPELFSHGDVKFMVNNLYTFIHNSDDCVLWVNQRGYVRLRLKTRNSITHHSPTRIYCRLKFGSKIRHRELAVNDNLEYYFYNGGE